jgi:hypothetical protein
LNKKRTRGISLLRTTTTKEKERCCLAKDKRRMNDGLVDLLLTIPYTRLQDVFIFDPLCKASDWLILSKSYSTHFGIEQCSNLKSNVYVILKVVYVK